MVGERIIDACDPGIRDVVRLLLAAGFQTTDSGDGVSKPRPEDALDGQETRQLDVRHVAASAHRARMFADADRMQALLDDLEPGWVVEATYLPGQAGACLLLATHQPDLPGACL